MVGYEELAAFVRHVLQTRLCEIVYRRVDNLLNRGIENTALNVVRIPATADCFAYQRDVDIRKSEFCRRFEHRIIGNTLHRCGNFIVVISPYVIE